MIGKLEKQKKPEKKLSKQILGGGGQGQANKPPEKGLDLIQEGKPGDDDVDSDSSMDAPPDKEEKKKNDDDDSSKQNSSDESDDDDESSIDMDDNNNDNLYQDILKN
mgnify:FL=1